MVKRPGTMCSRRRSGIEQEKQVLREESEGAKRVNGPDQAVVVGSAERDGATMES